MRMLCHASHKKRYRRKTVRERGDDERAQTWGNAEIIYPESRVISVSQGREPAGKWQVNQSMTMAQ